MMPEPRQQLDGTAAATLPIGPLAYAYTDSSEGLTNVPYGTISVSDDATPVVTLTSFDGQVQTSSSATFDGTTLSAAFTGFVLRGTFTNQNTASGTITAAVSGNVTQWSASIPVVQMPITRVPMKIAGSAVGTLTFTPGQMSISINKAPITLGNPGAAFDANTGILSPFNFANAVTINGVSYVGMSGVFLSNLVGSGTLIRSTGASDSWAIAPTVGLPTSALRMSIGQTDVGWLQILNGNVMRFMAVNSSVWQNVVSLGNRLDQQDGKIDPTPISFNFGTNTTYTSITGLFTDGDHVSGGLGSSSVKRGDQSWTAEAGTGEP